MSIIPKLVLLKQVFGNIVEEVLKEENRSLTYPKLKKIFQEYCKINSEFDLDILCRYVMGNPKNLSSNKISPKDAIFKYSDLLKDTVSYTEEDFKKTITQIDEHPTQEHKNELFTILQLFANKNGASPEMLLNVISGTKIDFNRKCLVIYLMRKSQSIVNINANVLRSFCHKRTYSKEKSLKKERSSGSLKIANFNLGSEEDEEQFDKNSLKFKLRRAIRTYFSKKLSERIEKFSRGQTMFEDDGEGSLSSEEITRKFFLNLAEYLHKNKMPLIRIIKKYIFDSVYYSKDVQLIYIDDFFKSLREYGVRYTQRQKDEVTESLIIRELNGWILIDMVDKILNSLGVKRGLPTTTKAMNYEGLDLKSIRIINRILMYANYEIWSKKSIESHHFQDVESDEIIQFIYDKLKDNIKIVEIVDSKGTPTDIEYVHEDQISKLLRENYVYLEKKDAKTGEVGKFKSRIIKEMELHENLQFLICISPNRALDKIMVKKLMSLLRSWANNEYIRSIGAIRRPDPKDEEEDDVAQVIEQRNIPKDLDQESNEDFEEYDLTDEDEEIKKKMERNQKMWERRKNRKSTKRVVC